MLGPRMSRRGGCGASPCRKGALNPSRPRTSFLFSVNPPEMNRYLAELVGTAVLVLLGDGVVANVVLSRSKGRGAGWIVVTAGWGCAVAIAVYSVGRISGAHLN